MVAFVGLSSGSNFVENQNKKGASVSSEAESSVTPASFGAIASSSPQIVQAIAGNDLDPLERNIQTANEISAHVNKTVLIIVNYLDRDARVSDMLKGTGLSLEPIQLNF